MKIITGLILLFFMLQTFSFAQDGEKNDPQHGFNYYITPNFGLTNYKERDIHFSWGLSGFAQSWPHLIAINYQRYFEFGPDTPTGSDHELNVTYNYLYNLFGWKRLFLGAGSGLGMVYITKKFKYIGEEVRRRTHVTKMSIPLEFKVGFLYPDGKLRLVVLNIYRNYNPVLNYRGWKLQFNIRL